ncbi:type I 3-dehydroquinate dehydratase [Lactiplantibacillus daowaiensis]|uniref:3-dehydroquinate dehydratase n=1 Tax=Lactiplantibacillus daowaiensis TaxID=2559918 RepID=A0ABW1S3D7_9LACO|nr:type I 3-dehydroquinate dehydratase [Lactiplantibacillus daowaiensis]
MSLKSVTIGPVALTIGTPKIGVTLTGQTRAQLLGQAAQVLTSAAQVVEWRLDQYTELDNRAELVNTAAQLRQVLGTIPVLATLRLPAAGGKLTIDAATYYQTYLTLVNNRAIDALDIDLTMVNASEFMPLTQQMRQYHIPLVLSRTYLTTMPTVGDLVKDYQALAAAGADIARLTAPTQSELDTLTLMTATAQARTQLTLPLIATAVGTLGRYAGVCGQLMGSSLTLGAVGRATAPGQLPVSRLKQTLQTLTPATGA